MLGNRELFGRLAARALLPDVERSCERWRPDLVLRDPCEHASAAVALRRSLRSAQVGISAAEAEWSSIGVAGPALEELESGLTDFERATPYLTRLPIELDPSRFPATVRFREVPPPAAALPDWWGRDEAPLLYLTFGTVLAYMTIAEQVFRTALRAVDGIGLRVLLTVGRRFDPDALGSLPRGVHVERWIDQAQVLPAADIVVCHGGSGTMYGALAAGVPVVVVPVFADQFENGRRLAASGAGLTVEVDDGERGRVIDHRDIPSIRSAVDEVLNEPNYRSCARSIADHLRAVPTADDALVSVSR